MKILESKYDLKEKIYRVLLVLFFVPVLVFAGYCALNIHRLSTEREELKKDYSTVNNIEYGLLSVVAWRDYISEIVSTQIHTFQLTRPEEDSLKHEINNVLNALIDQADSMAMQKQTSIGGKIKRLAVKTFVNVDKIHQKVPQFSQTIINQIEKPKNKEKMQFLAQGKLNDLVDQTHDNDTSYVQYDKLLAKYNAPTLGDFNKTVNSRIDKLQQDTYNYTYALLSLVPLFLLVWWLIRKHRVFYSPLFSLSILLAIILLSIGLTSPMIEIDARIKEINFVLLGQNIKFSDQVLFYQSKSILNVVEILLATHRVDSIFVGILILCFSVIFPISKLTSTWIYLMGSEKLHKNKLLNFFAFKSGKWSMADVMVVAIFMAYIGFKGVLDNQLSNLDQNTSTIQSISTNKTSLQPGFILFITFVLFGLILSAILKQITEHHLAIKELNSKAKK